MAEKAKDAVKTEFEQIVLVSPNGHKYEVTVSDEGNLNVVYKPEPKVDDAK